MSAAIKFGTWASPRTAVEIVYSLHVIDAIRQTVTDGTQRLTRGMEVGGVLYGTRESGKLRIEAMREIACEHAFGPSFQLSDADKAALLARLEAGKNDPTLAELVVLGWFVSHPRRDIALQPADIETYSKFFPEANHVTLVVRPGRGGNMRAGFFIRETDGTLKADRSLLDFSFPESVSGPVPISRPRNGHSGSSAQERPHLVDRAPELQPSAAGPDPIDRQNDLRSFGEPPPEGTKASSAISRKAIWVAVAAVAVLMASFAGVNYFRAGGPVEPLALSVLDQNGQLRIQWNHYARTVKQAEYGSLEIVDGEDHRTFSLTPQEMAQGNYTYVRRTGDIQVRLTVASSSGRKTQEASRFLGSAPSSSASPMENAAAPAKQNKPKPTEPAGTADVDALRSENVQQKARIQQLERTVIILQGRLGMEQEK